MNSSNFLKKSDFELFLNKKPAFPSCNIDFGPFGQSLDIIVALENAASVAGMLLTTECVLADIKEDPQTKKLDFTNIEWHSFPPESIAGKLIKGIQYWRLQGYFE